MNLLPLVNISPVSAGATITVDLPIGVTYHQAQFLFTNITSAQATDVQVIADNKVFQEFADFAEIDKLNAFYIRPQNGDYHTLWFDRPELNEPWRHVCAVGTTDLRKFQIKFKVDAACVNPAIVAQAMTSMGEPMGLITKIKRQIYNISGTGEQDVTRLPQVGKLVAVHFSKAADDITKLVVKRDQVDQVDTLATHLEELLKQYKRVPQALWCSFDWCMRGHLTEALEVLEYASPTPGVRGLPVQDLRGKLTLTTAGDVLMISEHIDSLSGA